MIGLRDDEPIALEARDGPQGPPGARGPRRIDLLTSLTGITFETAWASCVPARLGGVECDFIGREALIRNKRALGRPRDLSISSCSSLGVQRVRVESDAGGAAP